MSADSGGRVGLVVAGLSFILPAAVIVTGLAWACVAYGATPAAGSLLVDPLTVVLAGTAALALLFGGVESVALIVLGAAVGLVAGLVGGGLP